MASVRFVFLGISLLFAFQAFSNAPSLPPAPVEITMPKKAVRIDGTIATGQLLANRSVVITSEIAGKVSALHLPEGKAVSANSPLIMLVDDMAQASLQQAQAKYNHSAANFGRIEALSVQGSVSQSERDQALSNLRYDEANLALAKAQLAKTQIQAPFSGLLGLRQINVGDYIHPGQPLITLTDIDTLLIDFSLPEHYFRQIQAGQTLQITLSSIPDKIFTGKIIALSPQINHTTHTIQARASLANPKHELRPGLFVKVQVVFKKNEHAMVLPEQAVFIQQNKQFVYVITEGKASLREINIGSRDNGEVEVLSGLQSNEAVALSGHMRLYPGASVFEVKS